jgi:hypothetical protein
VTRGNDTSGHDGEQEQLDLNDPNQRSLLVLLIAWSISRAKVDGIAEPIVGALACGNAGGTTKR